MNTPRIFNTMRLLPLVAALALAGCAGTMVHSDGMRLLAEGRRDAALEKLREASRLDPQNSQFRIDLLNETQGYSRELIDRGDDARRAGRSNDAAESYAKALRVDPGNDRARQGLVGIERDARSAKLLAEAQRLQGDGNLAAAKERAQAALADNPGNQAAQRQIALIDEELEKARAARAVKAAAQSAMSKPVTLQFRDANLRMVFEALSRTTGLNVILDRDVRADLKTTIFVKDAAVEDTVDLILLQNQLEKRALNANTLFIYANTPAKQKEYQDLQVRTFQVTNTDVKYLQTVLKTVLKIKDLTVDERSGTLVMRDTPDAIAVAAKIIAAHDVPEPEVMLEVEVLEISSSRLSNLGVKLPDSVNIGVPTAANTIGLLRDVTRNDLTVSSLGVGINLKLEDTDSNILASPRIRARNKEKARILIGDRVPIITNTVTPVQSGGAVVTGSVQYQDVGLKLEFEPQVYADLDVGIKINLEVSTIVREIPGPNGSLAYQIGTRNAQTVLRLRDGETQILGGLISADDRNTSSRVPGVGHLPVVGRIFGNNSGTNGKTEIVLSITPRIVRAPAVLDASLRNIYSGTETGVRERAMQLDPVGSAGGMVGGGTTAQLPAPGSGVVRPTPRAPVGPRGTPPLVNSNRAAEVAAQAASATKAAPEDEPAKADEPPKASQ